MKRIAVSIGVTITVLLVFVIIALTLLNQLFRNPPPKQPRFGFTGNWKYSSTFGVEERPLPPSSEVWSNYQDWIPRTNTHTDRLYVVRLGDPALQSQFSSRITSGDTPMGEQKYTGADFTYNDPKNGTYLIHWSLRGEHDVSFLKFNGTLRQYQLRLFGLLGEYPPRLSIVAIEGLEPSGP